MDVTLEDALRMLDEAAQQAKSIRVDLDDEYRRMIAIVERRPQYETGADKTWVWRLDAAFRAEMRHVTRA